MEQLHAGCSERKPPSDIMLITGLADPLGSGITLNEGSN